jgi:hypothetical protein
MRHHLDILGYKVKDVVSGFSGTADSVCYDLYGCVQVTVNPGTDKDGKYQDSRWFDIKRLSRTSKKPVMKVPDFNLPEIGCADKPLFSRL